MHLYTEAKIIAREALAEFDGDFDLAREYLHQTCDSHEVAIYYGKAIEFCATQETSNGEEWLEDCGSLIQAGDTFGGIACRIAFATLLVASEEALSELESDAE